MADHWSHILALAQEEVRATLDEVPGELRERALPLPVVYERVPNEALVADAIEPDTLGLFVGEAFPDGEDFLNVLRKSGFKDSKAIPVSFGIASIYVARK